MKRFISVFTAFVILSQLVLSTIVFGRSLADVEKELYLKPGPSPMDAAFDTVKLTEGDLVNKVDNKTVSLSGQWEITDKGTLSGNLKNEWNDPYKVNMPNSIAFALYEAGYTEDPYNKINDIAAKELGTRTWYLKKTFTYNGDKKNVELNFRGVADRCSVYLNGELVGEHQGMFGGPVIDVTDKIVKGQNTLIVVLKPVLDYRETVVFNCSYGWHYALIPPFGIWGSVSVNDLPDMVFDSPFIATVSHKDATMDLSVDLRAVSKDAQMSGTLTGTIKPKNFAGKSFSFTYNVNGENGKDNNTRLRFNVPEFKLWWPNGYGEQNLYTLELSFKSDSGKVCYSNTSFGIRSLKLDPFPTGESPSMYNRTVVINGRSLFMKGSGWCTIDALMRFEREDYDKILKRAHEQGITFLRAWGGGMPETDDFYDLCDEYGITVYQEWPTCWDSQKTQPSKVLYETVIVNTKRIRNHPSLIIYGGGNEGVGAFDDVTLNYMGKLTYEYDGTRTFYRQDGGPSSAGMGHDHIHWGGQSPEHYISAYYNYKNSNLHEYGLDSMMNLESIAKYATEEEMKQWPIDPKGTIAHHTATFNGTTGWNPTPYGYDIDTFMHYASDFLKVDSLSDLVLGSQLAQTMADYLAIQNARIMFPHVTANVYYKLNDVYPGASWSTIDWYGVPKIAHYFVQDANRTLMATGHFDRYNTYNKQNRDFNLPIYILDDNEVLDGSKWTVTVKAYDRYLKSVKTEEFKGEGAVGTNKKIGDFYLTEQQADSSPLFIVIDLVKDNEAPIRSYTFMNYDRVQGSLFSLPRATIEYSLSGNTYTVKNTSNVPAVAVNFKNQKVSDTFVCEDNYFWLEPGETITIDVNSPEGIEGFDAFNMADTTDKKAPSAVEKLKVESTTNNSISLSWRKAKDDKSILGYYIYVNDSLFDFISGDKTSYDCTGLSEQTEYNIYIVAVDNNMNSSKTSKKISVSTKLDTSNPKAESARMVDKNTVVVKYSKDMDKASSEDLKYYTLNYNATVISATLGEDLRTVTLKTSDLDQKIHSIIILGAKDKTITGNRAVRTKILLEPGLVGYWNFDENEGDSVSDVSGYYSSKGFANKVKWTEGVKGSALDLEKKGSVSLGNTDFYTVEGATISMWVNPKDLSGFNILIAKRPKDEGHLEIYANEGNLRIYSPDITDIDLKLNIDNLKGEWHHLAFVFSSSKVKTYVDGKLKSDVSIGKFKDVDGNLAIGSLVDGSFPFGGSIDEVRLYTMQLDESQIAKLASKDSTDNDILFNVNIKKLNLKKSFDLKVDYIPNSIKDSTNLTWSSSDSNVATVDNNGKVTAINYGTAIITATTEDGSLIDKCIVDVGDFKTSISPIVITLIACMLFLVALIVFAIVYKKKINRN